MKGGNGNTSLAGNSFQLFLQMSEKTLAEIQNLSGKNCTRSTHISHVSSFG